MRVMVGHPGRGAGAMQGSEDRSQPTSHDDAGTPRIPAIQGLRGVAVLGVLLFHAGLPGAAGGYLGVDVFFVISGFVITNLLRRRVAGGDFSLSEFYIKRAWRLMPALGVVLVGTALVFSLLTPTAVNQTLPYSLLTSIVGVSNFYYAASIDYFDSGTSNPVLHTWSLGVEEQFYLVLPCLMLLLARLRAHPVRALLALAVLSFASAVYTTDSDRSAAFYMPWYRAWEFLAGALLVYVDRGRLRPWVAQLASYGGVALVLPAFIWYGEHNTFPGLGALAPVAGTALLILGATSASGVNRLLTVPPMRILGDASYSVYLVHWPIICLIGMFFPLAQLRYQLAGIVFSLLIGYLLWRWVEVPALRGYPLQPARRRTALVPLFMATVFTLVVTASATADALWRRNPQAQNYLASARSELTMFQTTCFLTYKVPFERFDPAQCLTRQGEHKLLVMGDSMAANIVPALRRQLAGTQVLQATAVDYRPGNATAWPQFTAQLDALVWNHIENVPDHGISSVLFFARWDADDIPSLVGTIERLKRLGISAVVLGPSPEFYVSLPLILSYSAITGIDFARLLEKQERRQLDRAFTRGISEHARYISMMDITCPAGVCRFEQEGRSLYFDRLHFSQVGAELFVKGIGSDRIGPGLLSTRHP